MDMKTEIISGGPEFLDRIAPLWEKMKKYHVDKSTHFSKNMDSILFEERKNNLTSKAKHLRVDIVINTKEKHDIGYCISTIDDGNKGEIDSLFILDVYRRHGLGERLTENALDWFNDNGVVNILIYVASGNDEVINFYKNFGFYPRRIQLAQKR